MCSTGLESNFQVRCEEFWGKTPPMGIGGGGCTGNILVSLGQEWFPAMCQAAASPCGTLQVISHPPQIWATDKLEPADPSRCEARPTGSCVIALGPSGDAMRFPGCHTREGDCVASLGG